MNTQSNMAIKDIILYLFKAYKNRRIVLTKEEIHKYIESQVDTAIVELVNLGQLEVTSDWKFILCQRLFNENKKETS